MNSYRSLQASARTGSIRWPIDRRFARGIISCWLTILEDLTMERGPGGRLGLVYAARLNGLIEAFGWKHRVGPATTIVKAMNRVYAIDNTVLSQAPWEERQAELVQLGLTGEVTGWES